MSDATGTGTAAPAGSGNQGTPAPGGTPGAGSPGTGAPPGGTPLTGQPGGTPITQPGGLDDWRASLPADLQSSPVIQNTKSIESLAQQLVAAQQMVGADKIALPSEGADQQQWDVFFEKLGRPAKADGYGLEVKSENFNAEQIGATAFADAAHKAGLSKSQAQQMFDWYVGATDNELVALDESTAKAHEDAMLGLRTEFGAALDQELGAALKAVEAFGGQELKDILESSGLGNDPTMIRAWIKVGKAMGEDTLGPGVQRLNSQGGLSPQEAKLRLAEIDKQLMTMDKMDPARAGLVEEKARIADMANPSEAGAVAVTRNPV